MSTVPDPETARRPRLLVVASTYPAAADDGTPGFVRDIALVEAEEFDTRVLVPRVPAAGHREERSGHLTVQRFRYFPRRWEDLAHGAILENLRSRKSRWLQLLPFVVAEALALRRAIRTYRPDVLHVHWILPQGAAALLAARKVPWLVTTLGGDVYALSDPISDRLKRAVLRRARVVTAMNSDMTVRLIAQGAPPEATHVLPMGADVEAIRVAAAGEQQVPGRIMFAGRLVEKKGVAVLLDALRRLPATGWTLDIVGDGQLRAELTRLADGLPVTFRGQLSRTELARSYARAEIAVVPSVAAASGDQDGLPVTLLEAMAVGCAVVASQLAGIDAAVIHGENGLLVPPGDAEALAATLEALLADPDRRAKLGAAARSRAEEFSVAGFGARYRRLLWDVLGGGWEQPAPSRHAEPTPFPPTHVT
jgi:colanic acid/amylovoran biosynthesis glycosyltransferase